LDERAKEPVKVVDRRLFTREGERRSFGPGDVPPEPPSSPPPLEAPSVPPEETSESAPSPLFEGLISFLAESAMMGVRAGAPLSNFSYFIDFLELLREKTRGNLTQGEAKILEETLGEMKLAYLQISQKPKGKGS
jgi:hypothetical protein